MNMENRPDNRLDTMAEALDNAETACEKNKPMTLDELMAVKKHRTLNVCVLLFTAVLVIVSILTFFVALFNVNLGNAYYIASMFVLCMLLAAPTLKVFLDKCTCRNLRMFNIIALVGIFVSILVLVVVISLSYAFPCWFTECNYNNG
ncbi:MAG: hypothetical protein FWD82_00165 [Defluviitaleaceae bacterium]|nr:hypothetical protein [Defluviitaleaceae bacterium]